MKHLFLAAIIISAISFTDYLYADSVSASQKHKNNLIAAELSITGQTDEFDDPYSLPAGLGILYEFYIPGLPVFIGAETEWYGFIPLEDDFGDSRMIVCSFTSGYCFRKYFRDSSLLMFSPSVSAGQYFRSFEKNGTTYKGSKPVIKTGVDIMLISEKNTAFSIGFFYFFIMDNTLFSFPGYRNRIGYVF